MKLKRLEREDVIELKNKKIYCCEKSKAYLKELKGFFPLLTENLAGVIDNNHRNQGDFIFEGRTVSVKGFSWLMQIDWSEAVLIITSDYYREVYEELLKWVEKVSFSDRIYYFANYESAIEESYRKQYRNIPLQNIILFRSGPHASSYVKGMDFSDNARALFEYMLKAGLYEKYELVWLVKNPKEFTQYQYIPNVTFLSFDWSVSENKSERDQYYRVLCLAKYLFFTDAYGFARNCRSDQIRVQLWHGCGFKTRVNFVRCEKRYEYTTVISDLYSGIHQDIYGLREDQVLVTGYAKQDWLFHPALQKWKKLELPKADKYIFWLPTFRMAKTNLSELNEYDLEGQTGLPVLDSKEKMKQLDDLLQSLNTVLVLKLHPFQDQSRIREVNMKNIVMLDNEVLVDRDIQTNEILGVADGLISDYSSAAVDYMLLDRPIGFTLEDVEEYADSRGFVFSNIKDWLPGMEIFDFEGFCSFVKEVGKGIDSTAEKRKGLIGKMHQYQDDQSCRRIVEALKIEF